MCEGSWDQFAPDHSWVGVIRMAPSCQGTGSKDGLSIGPGPNIKSAPGYDKYNVTARAIKLGLLPPGTKGDSAKVGYGCWFYMAGNATSWTSAKVNVGRSLRVAGHCAVNVALYGKTHMGDGLCTGNPGDKMWCLFARPLGYDSIQVLHGTSYYHGGPRKGKRRPLAELIDCTTPCMEQSYSNDACVPVARGVSPDGSTVAPCTCAKGQKGLTCDGRNHSYLWKCPGLIPFDRHRELEVDVHRLPLALTPSYHPLPSPPSYHPWQVDCQAAAHRPRASACRAKASNLTALAADFKEMARAMAADSATDLVVG